MGKKRKRQEKKLQQREVQDARHTSYVHQERIDAQKRREMKVYRTYAYVAIAIIVVAGLVYAAWPRPNQYTPLAQCMSENGAIMFGTDWCQFCQDQKRKFGSAFREIDYRNCDLTRECLERGVTSYPTWFFEDGSSESGVQELSFLANKTGCEMPSA